MKGFIIAVAVFCFAILSTESLIAKDQLTATIKTNKGVIVLELEGVRAPLTVGNFVNLARRGFYNGLKFHRVIANFMIQGGDPNGNGMGGPGYKFRNEISKDLKHNRAGTLAMANSGPNTNGSQFYITHKNTDWLDGSYNVFGYVLKGQDVVNKIRQGDIMESITIEGTSPKEVKAVQAEIDKFNKILDKKFPKLKPAKKL